jgi:hypothetical protein
MLRAEFDAPQNLRRYSWALQLHLGRNRLPLWSYRRKGCSLCAFYPLCMLREGLAGRDESGESCFEEAVRSTPDQPPRSWLGRFSERDSESRGGHSTGKCRTCCVCSRMKRPQRIYRWELLSPLIPVRPRLFSKATPSQWIATRSARLQ